MNMVVRRALNEQKPNNLFQAKIVFAARAITVGSG